MSFFKTFAIISGLIFVIFGGIRGQDHGTRALFPNLQTLTEEKLGTDDLLVHGIQYIPEYAYVTGTPEFEYLNGPPSVLYVKGQKFEGIRMAYDIVSDHALLIRDFGNGLENRITLFPAFVDSFTIGNHLFINPVNSFESFSDKGYLEKISDGRVKFLKKYRKTYLKIYDNLNRGKYSPQQFSRFLIDNNGKMTAVNSKNAFLNYFSNQKKNVRNYLNERNINFKKADHSEIRSLMDYCNSLPNEIL